MLLAESTRLLSLILPSLSHFSQFPNCGGLNTIQQATLTCRIASECFIPALMYYIEYAFTGFISSMKAIARAHKDARQFSHAKFGFNPQPNDRCTNSQTVGKDSIW